MAWSIAAKKRRHQIVLDRANADVAENLLTRTWLARHRAKRARRLLTAPVPWPVLTVVPTPPPSLTGYWNTENVESYKRKGVA